MRAALAISVAVALLSLPWHAESACMKDCRADDRAFRLLRSFEGYSPFTYNDAAGLPTIGFGHRIRRTDHIREPLVGAEAEALLESDAAGAQSAVNRLVRVPLNTSQFDALTCFTFNLGAGTLAASPHLLPAVNGAQHDEVPGYIRRYDKARVLGILRVLPGLRSRREAEAELYSAPEDDL